MMAFFRAFLLLSISLFSVEAMAQENSKENQQQTCLEILGESTAAQECTKVFAIDADCCIQYDVKELARRCAGMSTISHALTCFSEIHEVGFWKTDLVGENEPGLGSRHAEQWKRNVMRECAKETTKSAALECAVLQKSGTKYVFNEQNTELARKAASSDPIMLFCRNTFGDYWEGVEDCVRKQRAAKRRMGQ
ncbi:hypothetical protein G6L37_07145 [Agrobacterium rubi]|nr:hypothetical protein [Agrobacterium rubi]NTF25142.1 hypothetical protein [Agrobacterium rubi]